MFNPYTTPDLIWLHQNFSKDMDTPYFGDEPCWYSASVQWIEFPFSASIAEPVCG